jgi:hypothetical protein
MPYIQKIDVQLGLASGRYASPRTHQPRTKACRDGKCRKPAMPVAR